MGIRVLPVLLRNACGRVLGCAAGLVLGLSLPGCSKAPADAPLAQNPNGERRFPLAGQVVSADPAKKILVVRHNAVPGYMPAMTMGFAVGAGDASAARPGEKIRADLVVGKDGSARLENLWPDDKVLVDAVQAGEAMLRQDTFEKGSAAYREVGEVVPQFVLYDQDGRVVDSGRFRGRQVMLNFIYSRCPIATMCPAATLKMMETQRLAKDSGIKDIEFVSITLDPAYDTPGVLKEYAAERGIDTSNFSFLTGPGPAIKDLLTQFGVIAEFDGGILKHTLATLLIDPKGRIVWREDGSGWEPQEFVGRMKP